MGLFERFLSVWVGLAMLLGVIAGHGFPAFFELIAAFTWAQVKLSLVAFANRTRHWFPTANAMETTS